VSRILRITLSVPLMPNLVLLASANLFVVLKHSNTCSAVQTQSSLCQVSKTTEASYKKGISWTGTYFNLCVVDSAAILTLWCPSNIPKSPYSRVSRTPIPPFADNTL